MPADSLRPRPLGTSGMTVSAMSLGSWRTFERLPPEAGAAILAAARDGASTSSTTPATTMRPAGRRGRPGIPRCCSGESYQTTWLPVRSAFCSSW